MNIIESLEADNIDVIDGNPPYFVFENEFGDDIEISFIDDDSIVEITPLLNQEMGDWTKDSINSTNDWLLENAPTFSKSYLNKISY
jgi:hypothetical protein